MIVRRLGRLLLAVAVISNGVEAMRRPAGRVALARRAGVPEPERAARADAGVQIAAGLLLALNRLPRLSALLASLATVAGTAAAVPDSPLDPEQRGSFLAQLGVLGGLLVAGVDRRRGRGATREAARAVRGAVAG
jgi:uncharacterized membrane protein YphA (DoxX/SURF4 family)